MINLFIQANQINRLIERQKATAEEIKLAKRVAINATVKGLRLDAGKMIRELVHVKKSPQSSKTPKALIESRIKLFFASASATSKDVAGGRLLVKDIKIPIKFFSPKQTPAIARGKKPKSKKKSITTAKVMKGGSREVYPYGFGPNVKKLGYTIWERQGKARLPIKKQEGVDVAFLLRRRGGERRLRESANKRLQKNLQRRIKRIGFARRRTAAAATT
jgi:hypothetical protein